MNDELFVAILAILMALLLAWGFRFLPRERWQIFASLPRRKQADGGEWDGVNLTYYGVFSATANVLGVSLFLLFLASVDAPLLGIAAIAGTVLLACLPAARLLAWAIDGKRYAFTVAGAAFVGMLVTPVAILAWNSVLGPRIGEVPLLPAVSALAIAYTFGEGLGRLACISFGCCYGRSLDGLGRSSQRLFSRLHFTFFGPTKKIAWASGMEGVRVVPIQAMTATVFTTVGLMSTYLFLKGAFATALATSVTLTQSWRILSETLRADWRGHGKITAYQWMALSLIPVSAAIAMLADSPEATIPSVLNGLSTLWNPLVLLGLQALWVIVFLYTGRSVVTGSTVRFHLREDRI